MTVPTKLESIDDLIEAMHSLAESTNKLGNAVKDLFELYNHLNSRVVELERRAGDYDNTDNNITWGGFR